MTGRSVPEWVGKTPDSRPPVAVRLRVFAAYDGRCYLSGQKIGLKDQWDLDHIKPLHLAQGEENLNRESNLAPVIRERHREKTAKENEAKAKADRIRANHLGLRAPSKRKIPSRPFPKSRPALPSRHEEDGP